MRPDDGTGEVPALDDADDALIAKLRALPPEGEEPQWRELEAAIRARVAPLETPAPWWRNWRWLAPIGALAATAAIVAVIAVRRHDDGAVRSASLRDDASVASETPAPEMPGMRDSERVSARAPAVWLDGDSVELDDHASPDVLGDAPSLDALHAADDDSDDAEPFERDGVLPAVDYRWLDSLDDDAVARVETFLARKRS